jgi:hypothetical protein
VRLDRDGFPIQEDARSPWPRRLAAVAAALVLLLLGGGIALTRADAEQPLGAGPSQPPASAAVGGVFDPGLQAPPSGEPTPATTDPNPGQPSPHPTTSGPLVLVVAFAGYPTGTVTCTFPPPAQVYRLDVSVQANSTLDTATLAWKTTGTTNRRSAQPAGATATWTLPGFSAETVTWWVELKATDGRTFNSTQKTSHNPCLQPAG